MSNMQDDAMVLSNKDLLQEIIPNSWEVGSWSEEQVEWVNVCLVELIKRMREANMIVTEEKSLLIEKWKEDNINE